MQGTKLRSLLFVACFVFVVIFGVPSASAVSLKFNVSVTSSNVATFTPFSFDQVLSFTPGPSVVTLYPFAGNLLKADMSAATTFDPSPVTASLQAQLGQMSLSGSLYAESGFYQDFNNGGGQIHFQNSSTQLYFSGGVWNYDVYNNEFYRSLTVALAGDVQPMTVSRITQLLSSLPPSNWSESIYKSTSLDQTGFNQLSSESIYYSGTATFIEVVPEPASALILACAAVMWRRSRRA